MSRIAFLRAVFISITLLRSSASIGSSCVLSLASGALHSGQRLAKPGLSGFNSNSSPQTMQVLIGNGIQTPCKNGPSTVRSDRESPVFDFDAGLFPLDAKSFD